MRRSCGGVYLGGVAAGSVARVAERVWRINRFLNILSLYDETRGDIGESSSKQHDHRSHEYIPDLYDIKGGEPLIRNECTCGS